MLEAADVASHMEAVRPHFTIHLGDVYYVGDPPEVIDNCLGGPGKSGGNRYTTWPVGSVGSFALNSNHEMYARYFNDFLPKLGMRPGLGRPLAGQKTSYFCLQNKFWRILGLDTGYNSVEIPVLEEIFSPNCELRKELVAWREQRYRKTTIRNQTRNASSVVKLVKKQLLGRADAGPKKH